MPNEATRRLGDRWALFFAITFPTLVTWIYFVALNGQAPATQQTAYSIGKVVQFGFPVVWAFLTARLVLRLPQFSSRGVMMGLVFGMFVATAMLVLYHGLLKTSPLLADSIMVVRAKVAGIGIHSVASYFAVAAFYSLCHSLLEEYYWRWFVFGLLRRNTLATTFGLRPDPVSAGTDQQIKMPLAPAVIISSLGFMAHHVLVVATYFGWASPVTYFLSLSVAVGGGCWAWLYEKTGSMYGTWLSHLIVDAAIFLVGYDIIWGGG